MLFLLFHLGDDACALEAARVAEVLPLVPLRALPGAPPGVAGLFFHRGRPVPALDVAAMVLGRPSRRVLGTRLAVVRAGERLLGLILERAVGTVRRDPAEFAPTGVLASGAPALGLVAPGPDGPLQRIEPERLLSEEVAAALFRTVAEAA